MRIVFIGDVFGRSGREAIQKYLPEIQERLSPDVIIVNGENAANGKGINDKQAEKFIDLGADVITTGNHVWDQRQIIPYIARQPRLLRPINFKADTPGSGAYTLNAKNGKRITVVNVMSRLFMQMIDDPFEAMDVFLSGHKLGKDTDAIFVDFHGEATSEKMALGHHLDGRVTAVVGTHTHIPTADTHIMEKGTAYQSDAGMTGDYDSVIGVRKDIAIHRFVKDIPGEKAMPANGNATLCGCLVVSNDTNGKALSIEPLRTGGKLQEVWPQS